MSQQAADRIDAADQNWIVPPQGPPPAPKPGPAVVRTSSFALQIDEAFAEPSPSRAGTGAVPAQLPSYRSLFPRRARRGTAPPSYERDPPQARRRQLQRIQNTWTCAMFGLVCLIFTVQLAAVGLVVHALKRLDRSPGAATRYALVIVLASTAAEMGCTWIIAPCLHWLAEGAVFFFCFLLMAAEVLATSGFLFYRVSLDYQWSTCDNKQALRPFVERDCEKGLATALGTGAVRIVVTATCYLAVFAWYARERWGLSWGRPRPRRQPSVDVAL